MKKPFSLLGIDALILCLLAALMFSGCSSEQRSQQFNNFLELGGRLAEDDALSMELTQFPIRYVDAKAAWEVLPDKEKNTVPENFGDALFFWEAAKKLSATYSKGDMAKWLMEVQTVGQIFKKLGTEEKKAFDVVLEQWGAGKVTASQMNDGFVRTLISLGNIKFKEGQLALRKAAAR